MYRAADVAPRCPVCSSQTLTPETAFSPTDGSSLVRFRREVVGAPYEVATFTVDRARICVSCGHVVLTIGSRQLEELRGSLSRLTPDR